MNSLYLGTGVYAQYDEDANAITLFTVDEVTGKNTIILEQWVALKLTEFIEMTKNTYILNKLQTEQRPWLAHNFKDRESWMPLLGAVEELGELAHAHLKEAQGIRSKEDHIANAMDAIGDTVIYLAGYCSVRGFNFAEIVQKTWSEVKERDWKVNSDTGKKEK